MKTFSEDFPLWSLHPFCRFVCWIRTVSRAGLGEIFNHRKQGNLTSCFEYWMIIDDNHIVMLFVGFPVVISLLLSVDMKKSRCLVCYGSGDTETQDNCNGNELFVVNCNNKLYLLDVIATYYDILHHYLISGLIAASRTVLHGPIGLPLSYMTTLYVLKHCPKLPIGPSNSSYRNSAKSYRSLKSSCRTTP